MSLYSAVTFGTIEPITSSISKCTADTCTVLGLGTENYNAKGVFAATTIEKYPYCGEYLFKINLQYKVSNYCISVPVIFFLKDS